MSAFDYPNLETQRLAERATVRMTAGEALEHLADFYRTQVRPGADPRERWVSYVEQREALTKRAREYAAFQPKGKR